MHARVLSARALFLALLAGLMMVRLPAADDPGGAAKPKAAGGNSLVEDPAVAQRKLRAAEGLRVDLFAAEPDVANPVALCVDEQSRAFVVESFRRRSSVYDIRRHKDWLEDDFAFRTTADRSNFLRRVLVPGNRDRLPKDIVRDTNGDGVFDARDLEVETERIRVLADTNGDGRADRVAVFADGFTNLIAGVAAGVLARGDDVWFTCIPDVWRLRTGGDPFAVDPRAPRRVIVPGFGVHIAFGGHDMHGLIFGPDGRLYWSIADRGTDTNLWRRLVNRPPGLTPELLADSGCIFRSEPDGANLEVVAWGLRNPQELAFDTWGNLFTADNNGDGGDPARWHYVVEGADFGWRLGWQWLPKMGAWNGEKLWACAPTNHAAYLLPPLAHIGYGPAGLAHYPGTGLPDRFAGHFFLCNFPGNILTWTNIPDGAGFRVGPVTKFLEDLGATDIAFTPAGGVLVSDWFKSFEKSDKGRLWRVHDPAIDAAPAAQDLRRRLTADLAAVPTPELLGWLGHPDQRVRERARLRLVDPRNFAPLGTLALDTAASVIARVEALWAIENAIRHVRTSNNVLYRAEMNRLVPLLRDGTAEIRAQAARVLSVAECGDAREALRGALLDPEPRVRAAALAAWTRLWHRRLHVNATITQPVLTRAKEAIRDAVRGPWGVPGDGLQFPGDEWRQAVERGGDDPYQLHPAVNLLAEFLPALPPAALAEVVKGEGAASRPVRMAYVLALRRLGQPEVAVFLRDSDPAIVLEAARAIYDVPIAGALSALADWSGPVPAVTATPEAASRWDLYKSWVWRRVLNAHYRLARRHRPARPVDIAALASVAGDRTFEESLRSDALELLGSWAQPPARDRLLGLYRPHLAARYLGDAAVVVREQLPGWLRAETAALRLAAARAGAGLQVASTEWFGMVTNVVLDPGLRVEALRAMAGSYDPRTGDALKVAAGDRAESVRLAAAELGATGARNVGALVERLEKGSLREQQAALAGLARQRQDPAADAAVGRALDALVAGRMPPGLALDILDAAAVFPGLRDALAAYDRRRRPDDVLGRHRELLAGGDAVAGRKIFFENQAAACLRCHKWNGEGGEVGPELAGLAARKGRDYVLESILFPNRVIAPGFESVLVTTTDGRDVAGVLKSESDTELRIFSAEDNEVVRVPKARVKERIKGLSAMPDNLTEVLTRRDLRDLIEFLSGDQ